MTSRSEVSTWWLANTSRSAWPKSPPTTATTRTSVKKLAEIEKCDADPPSIRSRLPNGVSTASKATEPTTSSDMFVMFVISNLELRIVNLESELWIFSSMPSAHCLLPSAYCLLPTSFCLYPVRYSFQGVLKPNYLSHGVNCLLSFGFGPPSPFRSSSACLRNELSG